MKKIRYNKKYLPRSPISQFALKKKKSNPILWFSIWLTESTMEFYKTPNGAFHCLGFFS